MRVKFGEFVVSVFVSGLLVPVASRGVLERVTGSWICRTRVCVRLACYYYSPSGSEASDVCAVA